MHFYLLMVILYMLLFDRDNKKIIECYNRAIELDCNNINAWNGKGIALYFLGEYEKAIECYDV